MTLPLASPPTLLADTSLFFDFDGTLVDLAATPDAVVVDAALIARLDALSESLPGRIAIVSGRSIAQLDALLGDAARRFAIAGSHGAEHRTPEDGHTIPERPGSIEDAGAEMSAFALLNGLVYESKSLGVALHFRARPTFESDAIAFAQRLASEHGLTLQHGKMMVELRAPGDKGGGLRALMERPAMAGTLPLFFGDDVTDEDGFVMAAALGGAGVLIGDVRDTAALYRLPDVAGLQNWIDEALGSDA